MPPEGYIDALNKTITLHTDEWAFICGQLEIAAEQHSHDALRMERIRGFTRLSERLTTLDAVIAQQYAANNRCRRLVAFIEEQNCA